jgi:hypothetical protein
MTATTSGFAIDWDTTHGDDESLSVSRGGGEAKVQLDKEGRREAAKSALLASDGSSLKAFVQRRAETNLTTL